jgi:hypothetical protein
MHGRFEAIAVCGLLSLGTASAQEPAATGNKTNRTADRRGCIGSPSFEGKLDIEVSPAAIQPNTAYAIKVYLRTNGPSAMKLTGVKLIPRINAENQPELEPTLVAKEVPVAERLLVSEGKGSWGSDVRVWVLLVNVTNAEGDICMDRIALRARN